MKKAKINPIDLEELMVYMTEKKEEYEANESFDIHQEFLSKFGVTSEQFENILAIILPLVNIHISPLTNDRYVLLSDKKDGIALIEISVEKITSKN